MGINIFPMDKHYNNQFTKISMVNTLEQQAETCIQFYKQDNKRCAACTKPVEGYAFQDTDGLVYHSRSERDDFVQNVLNDF